MSKLTHQRQLGNWLAEYGSEVPDELFKLARFAWLTLQTLNQPTFNKNIAFQQASIRDLRDFSIAKQKWENP